MRPLQDVAQQPIEDTDAITDINTSTSETSADDKNEERLKPHIIRRNVEDYLERKALERRLRDVFDSDYLLD